MVANFGGTSFGDIALVPGIGLPRPKGICDITEYPGTCTASSRTGVTISVAPRNRFLVFRLRLRRAYYIATWLFADWSEGRAPVLESKWQRESPWRVFKCRLYRFSIEECSLFVRTPYRRAVCQTPILVRAGFEEPYRCFD